MRPRRSFFLRFACLALLVFVACSDSEDDGNGSPVGPGRGDPTQEMLGTWTFTSLTIDGTPVDLATAMDWHPDAAAARLHVYESSAFVYEEVNAMGGQLWAESGFVFVDGDEIDVNIEMDTDGPRDEMVRYAYTVTATVFELTLVEGGQTTVYRLTK